MLERYGDSSVLDVWDLCCCHRWLNTVSRVSWAFVEKCLRNLARILYGLAVEIRQLAVLLAPHRLQAFVLVVLMQLFGDTFVYFGSYESHSKPGRKEFVLKEWKRILPKISAYLFWWYIVLGFVLVWIFADFLKFDVFCICLFSYYSVRL